MKKALKPWQICGFIFTGIIGVLLHFLYEWTNESIIVAPVCAVNESIWEHMKLLFVPMFVFALAEYKFIGKKHKNYWCAKFAGTLIGLLLIPMIYYSYTGALGVNADWFNIVIFFIASACAYYVEFILLQNNLFCKSPATALIIFCVIAVAFVVLTFVQPKIPLFKDMTTGMYGIQ